MSAVGHVSMICPVLGTDIAVASCGALGHVAVDLQRFIYSVLLWSRTNFDNNLLGQISLRFCIPQLLKLVVFILSGLVQIDRPVHSPEYTHTHTHTHTHTPV